MISFRLNGKVTSYGGAADTPLLDVLRDTFGLSGVKRGCESGVCGGCAVLLNGRLTHACAVPAGQAAGGEVITIEGYRQTPHFEVLARNFEAASVDPAGEALPGLILAAHCVLARHPDPTEEDIRAGMAGSYCPSGYSGLVTAVQKAAKEGDGLW